MIHHCKAEELLLQPWSADAIIMDPPDNLGLEYDGYKDKRPDYYQWLKGIICMACQHAPVVWVSLYHQHDFEIKYLLHDILDIQLRTFVWTFTFGQDQTEDCGSGYRPILRLSAKSWKPDAQSIKVPSWRQENGDKRARPGGKVPLDVWDFPRVTNTGERCAWHPTQHPEALYIRMLKMSGALRPDFQCVDLFGGTGTLLRSVRALRTKNPGIRAAVAEQSLKYCQKMESPDFKIIGPTDWRVEDGQLSLYS